MPTEFRGDRPASLFLFAHQDDEFGVFHQIDACLRSGRIAFCVFATDGAATAPAERRDRESMAVLTGMGVPVANVLFLGRELGARDGHFFEKASDFARWLASFFDTHPGIETCYVPAWEGGHPDHDLLHAVAVRVAHARGKAGAVRQFSLYNGNGCPSPFFRVMTPLPENGPVEVQRIPWRDRFRYVRFCLSYPSQWRSWIGIFPFALARYMLDGKQRLQRVSPQHLAKRPHQGQLYYEARGMYSWEKMRLAVDAIPFGRGETGRA